VIEAVGITLVATVVTIMPAILWQHPMLYLVLLVMGWAAFRGGVRAVSLAGVGVAFAADWAAVTGRASDLIAGGTGAEQLLLAQLFLGVTLVASLTMAVEVAERRRAERAERRAEAGLIRAELAVANAADLERRRIAQETHDIVGHALNVMLLQAGAARRVLDNDDLDRSRQLLESLEDVGRHAFSDLDVALGLADDTPDGVANLGLSSVPTLVDVMRRAGMSVDLVIDGEEGRSLSTLVDWSAYRIIQEALTNASKHAPGAHTTVEVRYEADGIVISVVDEGAATVRGRGQTPGSGRGLIGMRERVAVLGGEIEIGPNGGAGFGVRARLPLSKTS
jgi:signal transduction histidine kinase